MVKNSDSVTREHEDMNMHDMMNMHDVMNIHEETNMHEGTNMHEETNMNNMQGMAGHIDTPERPTNKNKHNSTIVEVRDEDTPDHSDISE